MMPIQWDLRQWLATERGITRASEVSELILLRTGYKISKQAICDLLNETPKMIRLETTQALCDAFYCQLGDFCKVMPVMTHKSSRQTDRLTEVEMPADLIRGDAQIMEGGDGASGPRKLDFGRFFPDARKFSSPPKTE